MNELDEKASSNENIGTKRWWKIVKQFMSNKGYTTDEIPPIESNNRTYYSSKEIANLFNSFFISQSFVDDNPNEPLPQIYQETSEITEIVLTNDEVDKVLRELNPQKAVGPDKINNRILTASRSVIAPALTVLFNRCLNSERFPTVWKTAHVSPIHKKGRKDLCNNYRPISLLSCIGKALEKCVQTHTLSHLINNSLLTSNQSGFIPGDSTVYHLLNLYHDLCSSLDNKTTVQSIFFDISKAFDRVWHRGLVHKLNGIGIRGRLLNWFSDYLDNRKQAVVIKGEISEYSLVSAGVPQGSVLGPILFLIYINDIITDIQSTIKLFADDTSMYSFINNPTDQAFILNSDLAKINDWSKKWKVNFNQTKTELMVLSRTPNVNLPPLYFDNTTLEPTSNHKHLGVILQNDCKWDLHINAIITKCRPLVNCLRTFKYRLSRKALENLYKSYILPHFDYADVLWDNCTIAQSEELEALHLDALRTIIGSVRGTSHEKLYSESGFTTLYERRRRHKIIMYYKIVSGHVPKYLQDVLPPIVTEDITYNLRRTYERRGFAWDINRFRDSFFADTTLTWNNLPQFVQASDSIGQIKRFLCRDDHVIPSYFYYGERKEQIIHCRLRLFMSDLNHDMVNRHIALDPSCTCNQSRETASHYLLKCPLFTRERNETIATLPISHRTIKTLLNGNSNLSLAANTLIFQTVQSFIERSKRFQ